MNEIIAQRAAETVQKIMSEGNEALAPFEANKVKPFEFRWAWTGRIGESDYTYQKKEIQKVIGQNEAKGTRGGRGSAAKAQRPSLATMTMTCPLCNETHGILSPC